MEGMRILRQELIKIPPKILCGIWRMSDGITSRNAQRTSCDSGATKVCMMSRTDDKLPQIRPTFDSVVLFDNTLRGSPKRILTTLSVVVWIAAFYFFAVRFAFQ